MLEIQTTSNTDELSRLRKEQHVSTAVDVGSIQRTLTNTPGSWLIMLRHPTTYEVVALMIDVPVSEDRKQRKVVTSYCKAREISMEQIIGHLKLTRSTSAEIHVPSSVKVDGGVPKTIVYRHYRQALGQPTVMEIKTKDQLEAGLESMAHSDDRNKLEIHLLASLFQEASLSLSALVKLGFLSRKIIYAVSQQK